MIGKFEGEPRFIAGILKSEDIKEIIAQNSKIIEMNYQLIKFYSKGFLYVPREDENKKEVL